MTAPKLILASQSQTRIQLLQKAGLRFEHQASKVDENEIKRQHQTAKAKDLAQTLAKAKAASLTEDHPKAFILGADQTLSCADNTFNKAKSPDEAFQQLQFLRGKTHHLHSAITIIKNNDIVFEHVETASLTMRNFSNAFLNSYIENDGSEILHSIGCYHYEGLGIQLFENVEGDYSTILGLPLLPLLVFLRKAGIIEA